MKLTFKNSSINNVDGRGGLSECNGGGVQMIQSEKATRKFFITHQQFTKAVEPAVSDH